MPFGVLSMQMSKGKKLYVWNGFLLKKLSTGISIIGAQWLELIICDSCAGEFVAMMENPPS